MVLLRNRRNNLRQFRYLAQSSRALQYKLFVPGEYSRDPLPLVVMLHGGNQDADDFALGTGMNALAEEYGCVVLYPEQSSRANWSMCWNWFEERHHHRGQGEPGLIAALTRKVIDDYAIDASRVYVAGLSAGGAMAAILGRTYPELFAAVGCHSGLAHGSATDSYGAMQAMHGGVGVDALAHGATAESRPIIVFHGDADFTVHPGNRTCIVRQFLDEGVEVSLATETGSRLGRAYERCIGERMGVLWSSTGSSRAGATPGRAVLGAAATARSAAPMPAWKCSGFFWNRPEFAA